MSKAMRTMPTAAGLNWLGKPALTRTSGAYRRHR